MLFKTNLELHSFIKELTNKIYSVAIIEDKDNIGESFLKKKKEIIFSYTILTENEDKKQIICKISDNLLLCIEEGYLKIFYDINNINEFNFFMASLKKLKSNG